MNNLGRADYLALGDWNAVCSMCGRKRKAATLQKNWQGLWRCPEHNEVRHPQDFVRGVPDIQTPPWVQPMPTGLANGILFLNIIVSENVTTTLYDVVTAAGGLLGATTVIFVIVPPVAVPPISSVATPTTTTLIAGSSWPSGVSIVINNLDSVVSACTANGTSAVPGQMEPGCIVPGYLNPAYQA